MESRGPDLEAGLLEQAKSIIQYLARGVEFAAALVIGLAALEATVKSFVLFVRRNAPPERKNEVRLTLGRWLAVALELELAADILNTAVTPTWNDIEKLVAIATLRTALNYFLEREIRQESEPAQRRAERLVTGPESSATLN
ncbi:MAG: DUF1622 domain-containing protein [Acidobacteriota bacterium]|nr:DUF1622 domain-containing protein [Acidobacteriota bacterium]